MPPKQPEAKAQENQLMHLVRNGPVRRLCSSPFDYFDVGRFLSKFFTGKKNTCGKTMRDRLQNSHYVD